MTPVNEDFAFSNEQSDEIHALASAMYKEETGYTPKEHFNRASIILTTREDRNVARRRYNQIAEEATKILNY